MVELVQPLYETVDPYRVAYFRLRGYTVLDIFPDPQKPVRKRVRLDISVEEGTRIEMEYRNSEFARFVSLHKDTMDAIKGDR